jgi:hypothetical protein
MNSRTALYCADIAVHPVLLVAAVVWTAPIDQSEMPMWLACFSIGVFAWTLAEYLMHRFAFHRLPIIYDLHKAHHDDPRAHLGSPFWIGVPLLVATLALLISVGGRSAGGGTGTGLSWLSLVSLPSPCDPSFTLHAFFLSPPSQTYPFATSLLACRMQFWRNDALVG